MIGLATDASRSLSAEMDLVAQTSSQCDAGRMPASATPAPGVAAVGLAAAAGDVGAGVGEGAAAGEDAEAAGGELGVSTGFFESTIFTAASDFKPHVVVLLNRGDRDEVWKEREQPSGGSQ